jgi:acetate kinase
MVLLAIFFVLCALIGWAGQKYEEWTEVAQFDARWHEPVRRASSSYSIPARPRIVSPVHESVAG